MSSSRSLYNRKMCGRLALWTLPEELAEIFGVPVPSGACRAYGGPRYNVPPTERVVALVSGSAGLALRTFDWGIRLGGRETGGDSPARSRRRRARATHRAHAAAPRLVFNARAETLTKRPLFRDLVSGGRCAVVADCFFEWRREAGVKTAYMIRRRDGRPMALAAVREGATDTFTTPWVRRGGSPQSGVGERSRISSLPGNPDNSGPSGGSDTGAVSETGAVAGTGGVWEPHAVPETASVPETGAVPSRETGRSVIVTTEANGLLRPLHDRMPVVLDAGNERTWLEGAYDSAASAALRPASDDLLELVPVGTRVNRVQFDDSECVAARGPAIRTLGDWRGSSASSEDRQGSLF